MNDKNQTIINLSKKFDLSYCVYNVIYEKTNYRYKLTDENGNPTLKISAFKKVNYRYDFEKNILK